MHDVVVMLFICCAPHRFHNLRELRIGNSLDVSFSLLLGVEEKIKGNLILICLEFNIFLHFLPLGRISFLLCH